MKIKNIFRLFIGTAILLFITSIILDNTVVLYKLPAIWNIENIYSNIYLSEYNVSLRLISINNFTKLNASMCKTQIMVKSSNIYHEYPIQNRISAYVGIHSCDFYFTNVYSYVSKILRYTSYSFFSIALILIIIICINIQLLKCHKKQTISNIYEIEHLLEI